MRRILNLSSAIVAVLGVVFATWGQEYIILSIHRSSPFETSIIIAERGYALNDRLSWQVQLVKVDRNTDIRLNCDGKDIQCNNSNSYLARHAQLIVEIDISNCKIDRQQNII